MKAMIMTSLEILPRRRVIRKGDYSGLTGCRNLDRPFAPLVMVKRGLHRHWAMAAFDLHRKRITDEE